MKFSIYSLVVIVILISSGKTPRFCTGEHVVALRLVQARALYNKESDMKLLRSYFLESPSYSDLLAMLIHAQKKVHKKNGNDDSIYEQIVSQHPETLTTAVRGLRSPSTRSIRRRTRLFHTYGRKSHWDTFFG